MIPPKILILYVCVLCKSINQNKAVDICFNFVYTFVKCREKSDLLSPFCGIIMLLHYESFSHNRRTIGLNLTIRNGTEIARGVKKSRIMTIALYRQPRTKHNKICNYGKSAVKANNGKMGKFIQLSRFTPNSQATASNG